MSEKDIENLVNDKGGSSNIFDEFSTDSSLINEIEKIKEEQNRDMFYYISLVWKIFQNVFLLLLVSFIILFSYIYIQKNKNISDSAILDPLCFIFINTSLEKPSGVTYCSSISYLKDYYQKQIEDLKLFQSQKILENIVKIYEQENFLKTKEMVFLLNKSKNKESTLKVLENFDLLKNEFWWIDKSKIQCEGIEIDFIKKYLSMKCVSFSQWYEKWIIWFSWKKNYDEISWTSISIANSFLNYIEKNSSDFTLVDRQKIFSSEGIVWESNWYTSKTSFDVKLKINF